MEAFKVQPWVQQATSPMLETISFSPDAVYQELMHLNVSKACGLDLLPPLILKKAADFI